MNKVAAILALSVLITGCVDGKFIRKSSTNNCGGTGWTHTIVHYGDSRVFVVPLSRVVAGEEFRFILAPQIKGRGAVDYKDAVVKITGKSSAPWFTTISGQASANPIIFTCVDNSLAIGDKFEFMVEVYFPDDTTASNLKAMLDPRARVIEK